MTQESPTDGPAHSGEGDESDEKTVEIVLVAEPTWIFPLTILGFNVGIWAIPSYVQSPELSYFIGFSVALLCAYLSYEVFGEGI